MRQNSDFSLAKRSIALRDNRDGPKTRTACMATGRLINNISKCE